ncbi:MAG: hypothetical protein MUC83_06420 [Pirellula sp.]|jgi:hypothetical protein|nr:hypothetical protein [Pirellula sp.]
MQNGKRPREKSPNQVLNLKLIAFLVCGLAAYALVQPILNRNFGWNLPGAWQIVERLQSPEPSKTREVGKGVANSGENDTSSKQTQADKTASRTLGADSSLSGTDNSSISVGDSENDVETYLKKLSKNRYQSPAGLVYAPGSEEGHRLKHIERHLADIPNRPGSHGVFDGNMVDFLKAIDQAYLKASKREKGTSMKEDDGAMVYEASFSRPIGYLGGEAGKRQRNPKLSRMRLVVRGDQSVITAFPIR